MFNEPTGLALDATGGKLYVADRGNQTIRQVLLSNPPTVSTLAGTPGVSGSQDGPAATASFSSPVRLALDLLSNMLIVAQVRSGFRQTT